MTTSRIIPCKSRCWRYGAACQLDSRAMRVMDVPGAALPSSANPRAKLPTPGDWTNTQSLPSFLQASLSR